MVVGRQRGGRSTRRKAQAVVFCLQGSPRPFLGSGESSEEGVP